MTIEKRCGTRGLRGEDRGTRVGYGRVKSGRRRESDNHTASYLVLADEGSIYLHQAGRVSGWSCPSGFEFEKYKVLLLPKICISAMALDSQIFQNVVGFIPCVFLSRQADILYVRMVCTLGLLQLS